MPSSIPPFVLSFVRLLLRRDRSAASALALGVSLLAASPAQAADSEPAPLPAAASATDGAVTALDQVVVMGSRARKVAGSVSVLKPGQLKALKYDDPHAVLAAVPGVYTRGEDGVGLRPNIGLRGVNPDRSKKITLLEDGVPVAPTIYSAPAAYYFPLMARIDELRVLKGPAAIAYGPHTIGGAVDLLTRPIPKKLSGFLDVGGGEYGYAKLHSWMGATEGRLGFLLEGVQLQSTGFRELPSGADTGFTRREWQAKTSYEFGNGKDRRNTLLLKLGYTDEVSNETYVGLTKADFLQNPMQRYAATALDRMANHRISLLLRHVVDLTKKTTLTTSVDHAELYRIWRKVNGFRGASVFDVLLSPETPKNAIYKEILAGRADSTTSGEAILIGPNDREYVTQGVQVQLDTQAKTGSIRHRTSAGVRLHHDQIRRRHTQDAFLMQGGRLVPEGSPTETTAFNEAATVALSAHGQHVATWKDTALNVGLRTEAIQSTYKELLVPGTPLAERTTVVLLPGVGLYQGIGKQLGVFAGVYSGFSPPAPGTDQKLTDPERSTNYEAGLRWQQGKLRAELVGFLNDYHNLTDVCTLSSGCVDANLDRQFDAGEARIAGVEASAAADLSVGAFSVPITFAYTFTTTEFLNSFDSDDPIYGSVKKGDEMPYVPKHQAHLTAGLRHQKGSVVAGATYVAAMREVAGRAKLADTVSTNAQYLVDVTAKYHVFRWMSVYVNGRNLGDSAFIVSRRPYGARPNAPRWVQGGLELRF